jgi:hypothetical protein
MIGGTMRTPTIRGLATWSWLGVAMALTLLAIGWLALHMDRTAQKGYGIKETGLYPIYPSGYSCSPLTSLYASYIDVDGSRREERHSGVDGGGLGDAVLAPADATVKAIWRANWGWGEEGALLLRHSREDLGLRSGPPFYYSEFNHLRYRDVRQLHTGQRVKRGQQIAIVDRPGGKTEYLPEVHWEVYEVTDDDAIEWKVGKYGTQVWNNDESEILDPLYLLAPNGAPGLGNGVTITPFDASLDYSRFSGFTYILPCRRDEQ